LVGANAIRGKATSKAAARPPAVVKKALTPAQVLQARMARMLATTQKQDKAKADIKAQTKVAEDRNHGLGGGPGLRDPRYEKSRSEKGNQYSGDQKRRRSRSPY
jgi:hypothetical protein